MPTPITLNLLIHETHSPYAMAVGDFSVYPPSYTPVSPTLQVTAGAFPQVTLVFTPNQINVLTSENLGITCEGNDHVKLPDGIYKLHYSINPAYEHFVDKTILRIDQFQEKYDSAFMKMDMMMCDGPIRKQQEEELDSIYYIIQGAVASANKCAAGTAMKMYHQADKMLDNFINHKCNCNG